MLRVPDAIRLRGYSRAMPSYGPLEKAVRDRYEKATGYETVSMTRERLADLNAGEGLAEILRLHSQVIDALMDSIAMLARVIDHT